MAMARVEVITSVQRRRRWSTEDKERIVAASLEPGAVASEIARQAGIHASQLFRWRRQLCDPPQPQPGFVPLTVTPQPGVAPASALPSIPGVIEVEFPAGMRVRIRGTVDPTMLSAVLGVLAARAR